MTTLLFIASSNNIKVLTDFFSTLKDFRTFGVGYDISKIRAIMSANKKLIIIIDYRSDVAVLFGELVTEANRNGAKVIALCESIKEGFNLLNKGAIDMCVRPKADNPAEHRTFLTGLNLKVSKTIKEYDKNPRALKNKYSRPINSIIAIGSSTGGTECILEILKKMPPDAPPILVVQHMPPVFTGLYSNRLNGVCQMTVWEAKDGDQLENGLVLIAPGDKQMRLRVSNGKYFVSCTAEAPYGGHIPAVDVLFMSVASIAPSNAVGVILTGMGADGAKGLLAMRQAGAFTLGQDEKSCIVYGMPKAAYDIGAVMKQGDLDFITSNIRTKTIGR